MVNIGINESDRKQSAQLLNNLLANEFLLYTKTLKFHWNVKGQFFHDLHKLFEAQYLQLFQTIDEVAERAQFLGFDALGTLTEFQHHATLIETAGQNPTAKSMVKELLADHEAIIRQLREDAQKVLELNDDGTNDFMLGLMQQHEKTAWMLRALLAD